jgi:hypothetical protein
MLPMDLAYADEQASHSAWSGSALQSPDPPPVDHTARGPPVPLPNAWATPVASPLMPLPDLHAALADADAQAATLSVPMEGSGSGEIPVVCDVAVVVTEEVTVPVPREDCGGRFCWE